MPRSHNWELTKGRYLLPKSAALPVHKLKPRNSRHSLSVEFHLVFPLLPKLVESTPHNCTGSSSVQRWHSRRIQAFDAKVLKFLAEYAVSLSNTSLRRSTSKYQGFSGFTAATSSKCRSIPDGNLRLVCWVG